MKLSLLDFTNKDPVSEGGVSVASFAGIAGLRGMKLRADIISRVVAWQLAKRRLGTAKVKNRGEVRASTRKIYKQKGTGGARHGALSANLFRGGGRSFGPKVRSYEYALNKKIRRLGLRHALARRVQGDGLFILAGRDLKSGKTADLERSMAGLGFKKVLVLAPLSEIPYMRLAASNIVGIDFLEPEGLNVYDLMMHDQVLVWQESLAFIDARITGVRVQGEGEDKVLGAAKKVEAQATEKVMPKKKAQQSTGKGGEVK